MSAVVVQDLVVRRGRFTLRLPELRVEPGERVVLMGPSGAGKSTLVAVLGGRLAPTAGRVQVLGQPPSARPEGVAEALQGAPMVGHLGARANVQLAARVRGQEVADEAVEALLAELGVAHLAEVAPATWSEGERQRVGVVRSLVLRPRLWLADEPTTALDADARARVLAVAEAQRPDGGAALVVSHDPAVGAWADRIVRWSA